MKDSLREQLREARRARQHSQQQAAQAMGVSVDGYRKWEQGTRTPTGLYRKAVERYVKGAPEQPE